MRTNSIGKLSSLLSPWLEERDEKPDPNNLYFINEIVGGAVPTEYIPSVEAGFRQGCVKGAKYGFPCVNIQVTLVDGKAHDVDSSADTFKLAAMEGFRDAQALRRPDAARADHERGGARPGPVPGRPDPRR